MAQDPHALDELLSLALRAAIDGRAQVTLNEVSHDLLAEFEERGFVVAFDNSERTPSERLFDEVVALSEYIADHPWFASAYATQISNVVDLLTHLACDPNAGRDQIREFVRCWGLATKELKRVFDHGGVRYPELTQILFVCVRKMEGILKVAALAENSKVSYFDSLTIEWSEVMRKPAPSTALRTATNLRWISSAEGRSFLSYFKKVIYKLEKPENNVFEVEIHPSIELDHDNERNPAFWVIVEGEAVSRTPLFPSMLIELLRDLGCAVQLTEVASEIIRCQVQAIDSANTDHASRKNHLFGAKELKEISNKDAVERGKKQLLIQYEGQWALEARTALENLETKKMRVEAKARRSFIKSAIDASMKGGHEIQASSGWDSIKDTLSRAGFAYLEARGKAEQEWIDEVKRLLDSFVLVVQENPEVAIAYEDDVPQLSKLNDLFRPLLFQGWSGYKNFRDQWILMRQAFSAAAESDDSVDPDVLAKLRGEIRVIESLFSGDLYRKAALEHRQWNSAQNKLQKSYFWSWGHTSWMQYRIDGILSPVFFSWVSSKVASESLTRVMSVCRREAASGARQTTFGLEFIGTDESRFGRNIGYSLNIDGSEICDLPLSREVFVEFLKIVGFRAKLDRSLSSALVISW
jgi:hypothetical protein